MNPLEQENVYGVHLTASNTVEVETEVVDGCGSLHLVVVTLEVVKDTTMREASDTNKITVHRKYALLMERLLQRRHGRTGTPLTTEERIDMESFMQECLDVYDENGVPYLDMVAHQSGTLVRKETLGLNPFTSAVEPVLSPELDHDTLTWKESDGLRTDVDRLQAYHYDPESGTGFLATVMSVPLQPRAQGKLQARLRLRGVCSSVSLLRADIRKDFTMVPRNVFSSPRWVQAIETFVTRHNRTFKLAFKDFCKHGGFRFVGLEFLGETSELNHVLFHNNKAIMRRTGRGENVHWCSSEGYHCLEWDITKPLYRQTNSTADPLFVDPATFRIEVADEANMISKLSRRLDEKVAGIDQESVDAELKRKKKKMVQKYYLDKIRAAKERSWGSLNAIAGGKQWLGPDLFLGADGLATGDLDQVEEVTYQAMLVVAILETSGFAPHREPLNLRRTLLQERVIDDARYAFVQSCDGHGESKGLTRVEVLPADMERHERDRSLVTYEGKAVRHFRELNGVPYHWTFSEDHHKEEEYTWFPYRYNGKEGSRLTIGCGASFSAPSGAQRFLHRRAFPMASRNALAMKQIPTNDAAKDWCDGVTPTTGIFSGAVGFHLQGAGIGGGKEDKEAVERMFQRARGARDANEAWCLDASSGQNNTTADYTVRQQGLVDDWSRAKREALKDQEKRLAGFSKRFRGRHMYTIPAVELSAASLTLTQTNDGKSDMQTDYPTLFLGPSTYAASPEGIFVGGRPQDYRHSDVEMDASETLFMDVVYHGKDGPTSKINGSRALASNALLAPNTEVLVRSETGKTVKQGSAVVGRFQRGVFLQRNGELIMVQVGNETMYVPQGDVRVLYRVKRVAKRFAPIVKGGRVGANELRRRLDAYDPLDNEQLSRQCVEIFDRVTQCEHRYSADDKKPQNFKDVPAVEQERFAEWANKDHLVRSTAISMHLPQTLWPKTVGRSRKKDEFSIKYRTLKARSANATQRLMTRRLCFDGDSHPVWDELELPPGQRRPWPLQRLFDRRAAPAALEPAAAAAPAAAPAATGKRNESPRMRWRVR